MYNKFENKMDKPCEQQNRPLSDFSIEHILNKAGGSDVKLPAVTSACERVIMDGGYDPSLPFPWLHCTRYCPPKIQRNCKREGQAKRQLGRHPRIPFTSHQLSVLEDKFRESPYISSEEVTTISRSLQLTDIRVKIWFQNRRARERREQIQPKDLPVKEECEPSEKYSCTNESSNMYNNNQS